jgi:hypothetical protein
MKQLIKRPIIIYLLFVSCSSILSQNDYSHFTVYAVVSENDLFKQILKELYVEDVFTDKYQMVINLKTEYPEKPYIVIGKYDSPNVEKDRKAYRFLWEWLSKETQSRILLYNKKIPMPNTQK